MVIQCQRHAKYFIHVISFDHNNSMMYVLLFPLHKAREIKFPTLVTLLIISKARICVCIYMTLKHTSLGLKGRIYQG